MSDADEGAMAEVPSDPDEVRALLKARLVPEGDVDRAPVPTVHREVMPAVAAVLVIDLPDRVVPLAADRAAQLGDEVDDLFETAYENVRSGDHPDIDVEEPAEGVPIMVLSSPSFFAATHALWADRFLDAPDDGLLVAVPHRHVVLVHALRDAGARVALPNLVLLARHHHDESESPVSPWLYWWHEGTFERLDVSVSESGDEVSIALPEGLAAALERLG